MNYLIILFFILLMSCSTAPVKQSDEITDLKIIDAHVHTGFDGEPEETSHIPYTQQQLFKEFDEAHVIGAVSMNQRDGRGYINSAKVINCVGVSLPVKYSAIEQGLKDQKYRCIKIYLGYVHAFAYDSQYKPLYRMAEKYKVPVVFHTGDTYSTKGKLKFADPLTIDEVAVDFPNVKFVIAHIGNPWIQSAAEVAYKNPNVYLDGSALLIGNISNYSPESLQKYVIQPLSWTFGYVENPKKLMFGSDWPLASIKDYVEAFKKAIPEKHWEKVFRTNAEEVFNLTQ